MVSWMDVVLIAAMLYCVYTDIRFKKIKNYITFPLMVIGLIYNIYISGFSGVWFSLKGILLSFVLTLPLFLVCGLGMGDVKLFMAIGSIKGAAFSLGTIVYSFFASILISLFSNPRKFIKAVKNVYMMIVGFLYRVPYNITEKESALVIPYAVSIMCGLILTYILGGEILWSGLFTG